jgi:hypothetical protein
LQISFNQSYFGALLLHRFRSHRNTDIGLANAGASLIPSPAMATILPWSCNLLILIYPLAEPMKDVKSVIRQRLLLAVFLSPVSIITFLDSLIPLSQPH